jgi:gluconokinase
MDIGLDLGTAGCRAALYDAEGRVVARADRGYRLSVPHPGWAEQDADEVVATAVDVLRDLVARFPPGIRPRALGLSSVLHSVLPLDRERRALAPAITWADTRSAPQAERLRAQCDPTALYHATGCPLHPLYWPAKLQWLREHRPDVYRRARWFVSLKEHLLQRLCGRVAVDLSVASGTGLLDLRAKRWHPAALDLAGIREEHLSALVEPTTIVGEILPAIAEATGLPRGLPVVVGAADGPLASLGSGALGPGRMAATIGTSGAVRVVLREPRTDQQARTWCYYLAEGWWVAGAAINNGGIVYRWVRDHLFDWPDAPHGEDRRYAVMDELAEGVPPGSDGLLFLPFLAGERAPRWNADARGALLGLTLHHTRGHLVRATLEGVAFRMRSIADALEEAAGPPTEVRASGSFSRSRVWVQILADVLGRELLIPAVSDATAFGAAFLARRAMGDVDGLEEVRASCPIVEAFAPNPATRERYESLYRWYREAYAALQGTFAALAAFQRTHA